MHPLSTYEVHRQDQDDLLRRSARLSARERVTRPRDDAHGRPPDPPRSRRRVETATVRPRWTPTT